VTPPTRPQGSGTPAPEPRRFSEDDAVQLRGILSDVSTWPQLWHHAGLFLRAKIFLNEQFSAAKVPFAQRTIPTDIPPFIDDDTFRSMLSAAERVADEVGCNHASVYQQAARTITRLIRHLRRERNGRLAAAPSAPTTAEGETADGCSCAAWKANIDILNAPLMLAAARNPSHRGYTGEPFGYCPWCGGGITRAARGAGATP